VAESHELTLTFLSGPRDGERIRFPADGDAHAIVFGRAAGSDVLLSEDPDVSRRHARLEWSDGVSWLEDLGSRNGTFVGEFAASRRIAERSRLEPVVVFRVGNTRFRIAWGPVEKDAAHAAAAGSPAADSHGTRVGSKRR
jgi:predicted component of type VI protein secretion system